MSLTGNFSSYFQVLELTKKKEKVNTLPRRKSKMIRENLSLGENKRGKNHELKD